MLPLLNTQIKRVLITGGAGFIGGALVRRLLRDTKVKIFNLDKLGYASDLTSINQSLAVLSSIAEDRYQLMQVDLVDAATTAEAVKFADPDLVMHLAAESHVDRSIDGPEQFLESNIIGTFNLLQALRNHWDKLPKERQQLFRLHHVSTDEVFGSLGATGSFSENTPYDPRSPYSSSKAASDHLVNAWHHTYGLPVVLTNCSNNYGPWQFPEKLIPVVILKAVAQEPIPLYGDGGNVRDWLYVEDHVDALLLVANLGKVGSSYCIGGHGEHSNKQIVQAICDHLDRLRPSKKPHASLITLVTDRPGHDRRYAIDPARIMEELGWEPKHCLEEGLETTVQWYLQNLDWCDKLQKSPGYVGERIGVIK